MQNKTWTPATIADSEGTFEDELWHGAEIRYEPTTAEVDALEWLGDRYASTTYLLDCLNSEDHHDVLVITADPWVLRDALIADGVDRIPCLDESTTLARIAWLCAI
jgi:hypothetical protein